MFSSVFNDENTFSLLSLESSALWPFKQAFVDLNTPQLLLWCTKAELQEFVTAQTVWAFFSLRIIGESADAWTIRSCRRCNKLQGDRGGRRRANIGTLRPKSDGGESRWLNLEAANKRNNPEQRKWPQVVFFSSRRREDENESAPLRWTKRKQSHHFSVCLLFNFSLLSWFFCISDVVVFPKVRLLGTLKSHVPVCHRLHVRVLTAQKSTRFLTLVV